MIRKLNKILVIEPMFSENLFLKKKLLKYFKNVTFNYKKVNKTKVINLLKNKEGLILGLQPFDEDVVNSAKNLKIVAKFGTGLDNVDLKACKRNNIKVINAPKLNSISVAELVLSCAINLKRNINVNHLHMKNGRWKKIEGSEIYKKRVGIIGLGAAGKEVAKRFFSFGSILFANDIEYDKKFLKKYNIKKSSKLNILKSCDIITLHVPLTKKTYNLINKDNLKYLKKNTILINTSRGSVLNLNDLNKIKDKKNLSIFIDVFDNEPYTDKKFLDSNNSIFTPHIGGTTLESKIRIGTKNINDMLNYFNK